MPAFLRSFSIFLVSLRFLEIFFFQNFFFYSFSIVSRIKIIISITRSVVASSRLALSDYATASSLSLSRICLRNRLITGRNDRFSLTFFRALREFRMDARARARIKSNCETRSREKEKRAIVAMNLKSLINRNDLILIPLKE